MITSWILAAGLLTGQIGGADDSLALEVRRLMRQLDAPRLAEREEAEQQLIELGPDILDRLPLMNESTPAEIRQRLGRVRQNLERALAESITQGSRVTLTGRDLTLSEIFAAFGEQTQNEIVDEDRFIPAPVADRLLDVDFDDTPFWPALDEVLDQAGLSLDPHAPGGVIRLDMRAEGQRPRREVASYNGPFRFEPVTVHAVRNLRDPSDRSLRLTLEVAWEPRLAPITILQRMADLHAVDEKGNSITIDSPRAQLEIPVQPDTMAASLHIPMVPPEREIARIATLEGSLAILMPGKVETFRFENIEQADQLEKRVAGVSVVLDKVRKNNDIWEVLTRVRFDEASGSLASHRNWIYDNKAYLEDPEGNPVENVGFETTRRTETEVGIAYLFIVEGPLADHEFVYKTPGVLLSRTIDYTIKDILLP